jgi:hypothetical protein
MNYSGLLFIMFLSVSYMLVFAIWTNNHVYAQQLSSPSTASSPSTIISPEIKAKMCDPSNPDLKIVNTTEARICGIAKTIKSTSAPSAATPLARLPNSTISNNNTGITTTTNVPIVLRPLPGGTCPIGYHLVSGTVCIKDLPSTARQTIPTTSKPTTTNATRSFTPIPSSTATISQPGDTNPTNNDKNNKNPNNEENFNTKILKSFNKKFK